MPNKSWPTKLHTVTSLQLDPKNPRLGRETTARAPREIIQYLFEHDKAMEVAESIAARGFFPNEPLLGVKEDGHVVVVEGNRRLAALKALREPGLLEGTQYRRLERIARQIVNPTELARVPVTLAPTRRATDQQIAGRHIGTPVLAWQAENRASFILDKLDEGYSDDQIREQLGFSVADVQVARETRAIADMARSLDLPNEIRAKLDNPRAKLFSTIKRVFDSSVGRNYLLVEPDRDHGIRGKTTKAEFLKGFTKLVTDIALGRASSRKLNKGEDIEKYFKKWSPDERPVKKRGKFVPSDIIKGPTLASPSVQPVARPKRKSKSMTPTVLPRSLRVVHGTDRMIDIRRELTELKRDKYPNAGAVLLRVFFELSAFDFLNRSGDLQKIIGKLDKENKLQRGAPTLRQVIPDLIRIAKRRLPKYQADLVEKAIKYNAGAPFTISDLHAFIHSQDFPGERDILQFWTRTEPFFRLMLETDIESDGK